MTLSPAWYNLLLSPSTVTLSAGTVIFRGDVQWDQKRRDPASLRAKELALTIGSGGSAVSIIGTRRMCAGVSVVPRNAGRAGHAAQIMIMEGEGGSFLGK